MTARAHSGLRRLCLWVLLAPFVLLSLLSPGVMPARAADGTLVLVLCSDGGTSEMVIDLATGQPVEQTDTGRSDRCDWACGQMALADLALPIPPAPVRLARPVEPAAAPVSLSLAHATGLPPATGPPAAV